MGLGLPAGQTHDGRIADTLLDQLGPHTIVLADKAYDADRIRALIEDQGATPNIPPRAIGAGGRASASASIASATSSNGSFPS
jgi:transposase